jgi:lipid II:glycine glycyltransferase (peptidoglycan interpeptide bridge formation enzyme)
MRCRDAPDMVARMADLGFQRPMRHPTAPKYVTWVHLDRTPDEIFNGFAKKTRQYIRLAHRRGIEVVEGGADDLEEIERLWRATGERCGFRTRPLEWLRDLHELFSREDRICVRLARDGSRLVAAIVGLATAGHVATVIGPNEDRQNRATRVLHWEVIRWASRRGARVCDLRGSGTPDPESKRHGLFQFKRGFRGELVELVGEFDLVLDPAGYEQLLGRDTEIGQRQRKMFKGLRAET